MEEELRLLQALIVDVIALLYDSGNKESYGTVSFAGSDRRYPILQSGLSSREHSIYYTNAFFPLHEALSVVDGKIMVSFVTYDESHILITQPFLGFELFVGETPLLYKSRIRFDVFSLEKPKLLRQTEPQRGAFDYGSKELEADYKKYQEELRVVHEMMECETIADVQPVTQEVHWTPCLHSHGGRWCQEINDYTFAVGFFNTPFLKHRNPLYIKCPSVAHYVRDYKPISVAVEVEGNLLSVETALHLISRDKVENFERIQTISDLLREN